MSFIDKNLTLATVDGVNFTLVHQLSFVRLDDSILIAREGTTTDGFSAPQAVTSLIPVLGNKLYAGIMHDAAYRNTLMLKTCDGMVLAHLSRKECDKLMLEILESLGVGFIQRNLIYHTLRLFGGGAFRKARSL